MFFFEKKNQKTFATGGRGVVALPGPGSAANGKKFFGSFFQKRTFLLTFFLFSVAHAEVRPRLVPARDVTVDYAVQLQGRPELELRVQIRAGGQRLRITSPDLPTTFLVNRQAETAVILLPFLRAYSEIHIARFDPEVTLLHGAVFRRAARARLAGRACTEWRASSAQGEVTACITGDGVILRGNAVSAREGALGSVRALRVADGAPPGTAFEVPAGFTKSPLRLEQLGVAP
jgi:hypothetical protein